MMNIALREKYEKEGYLLGVPILTPEEVKHYGGVFERLDREVKQRITNQHLHDPELYALATRRSVLDLAELALGPDVILLSSGFFVKQPGSTHEFVAWHQDTMYWGLEPPLAATVWIGVLEVRECRRPAFGRQYPFAIVSR